MQALLGKAAVANARLAYQRFKKIVSGPRWRALEAEGAMLQRPLWASTSTKNPAYPDVLYVEELIGPDTINTMPAATIDAFRDHGRIALTLERDPDGAEDTFRRLAAAGIDLDHVTRQLQAEAVTLFAASFDTLIETVERKRHGLLADRVKQPVVS